MNVGFTLYITFARPPPADAHASKPKNSENIWKYDTSSLYEQA